MHRVAGDEEEISPCGLEPVREGGHHLGEFAPVACVLESFDLGEVGLDEDEFCGVGAAAAHALGCEFVDGAVVDCCAGPGDAADDADCFHCEVCHELCWYGGVGVWERKMVRVRFCGVGGRSYN